VTESPRTLDPLPLGVVMRLNARTRIELDDQGDRVPALMLTYPPARFDWTGPDAERLNHVDEPLHVEGIMRRVAASLDAAPGPDVPDAGLRITLHGLDALLWLTGCPYALKLSNPRWLRALNTAGLALLAVGLDELSPTASAAEVDEYRETARAAGRMHCAYARVGRPTGGAA
jgi:hypothetical protein